MSTACLLQFGVQSLGSGSTLQDLGVVAWGLQFSGKVAMSGVQRIN